MRMIFGGHIDAYDYHRVGLNYDFLIAYLGEAGFKKVERVTDFGIFNDTSRMEFNGVKISLNIIAYKTYWGSDNNVAFLLHAV